MEKSAPSISSAGLVRCPLPGLLLAGALLAGAGALTACQGVGMAGSSPDGHVGPDSASPGPDMGDDRALADAPEPPDGTPGDPSPANHPKDRAPDGPPAELVWGPCDTSDWPAGYPTPVAGVECTTVEVPVDHAQPMGPTTSLRVARQTSHAFPSGQAVFNIAGGPGGGSVWESGTIPRLQPELLDRFDLVYVDQRGTGQSGYMDCPGGTPTSINGYAQCASLYTAADLAHRLTLDAAHDLDAVRRRLGYERIHVRGGSYGTRVALELMRQHPETLVAVVLDGLAPPDVDLLSQDATVLDTGIRWLVADCSADPACTQAAPDLLSDLGTRRQTLKTTPHVVVVGGQMVQEDEPTYLAALAQLLGLARTRYQVPRAIHQAVQGDNTLWNGLLSDLIGAPVSEPPPTMTAPRGLSSLRTLARLHLPPRPRFGKDYIAPGLFMAVMCAEFRPNAPSVDALRQLVAQQTWGNLDTTSPDLAAACQIWPVMPIDAALRMPVTSDVKTLLMNGSIDLNTFPENGAHTAATLSQATNVIVPHATHSTLETRCGAKIIASFFLADGDIAQVDRSCLDQITPPSW